MLCLVYRFIYKSCFLLSSPMATLTPAQRPAAKEMGTEIPQSLGRSEPLFKEPLQSPLDGPKDLDEYIRESEEILRKPCKEFQDHVAFVNTIPFMIQAKMKKLEQSDHSVYLEAMKIQHELLYNHNQATRTNVIEDPISIPAHPFNFDMNTIDNITRTPVLPAELDEYRRNPDALMNNQMFVSCEDDEVQVFKVAAVLSRGPRAKIFYVVSSEDPAEAVAYSAFFFFDMLASSERVVT
ncbi:hypothetical protein B0H11DRAFT_2271862 [Mycena galericulata]|nr:hypothetical protein B0H11DRAFT_2271862 [Mycena galericulata]